MRLLLVAALVTVALSEVVRKPLHKFSSLKRRLSEHKTGRGPQRVLTSDSVASEQPIYDFYDDYYLVNISIGTPAQEFTVMLDTSTSDLWVIDAACIDPKCKGTNDDYKKNQFDTSKSSTFKRTTQKFRVTYGGGTNDGYIGLDVIDLGGLTYDAQGILVTTSVGYGFGGYPIDGVLGLGWPALAQRNVVPVLQNLLPQLTEPIFTIWLDRHVTPVQGLPGGQITFGGTDSVNCDAEINYVPLSSQTYWQFTIDMFSVGTYYRDGYGQSQVISDTGTSFLAIPGNAWQAFNETVQAHYDYYTGQNTVPCDGTYPDLKFTFGGIVYTVTSDEYILDLELGGNACAVGVTPYNGGGGGFAPDWILGDVWSRTFCNVYDVGNSRIGFAKAHHSEI